MCLHLARVDVQSIYLRYLPYQQLRKSKLFRPYTIISRSCPSYSVFHCTIYYNRVFRFLGFAAMHWLGKCMHPNYYLTRDSLKPYKLETDLNPAKPNPSDTRIAIAPEICLQTSPAFIPYLMN